MGTGSGKELGVDVREKYVLRDEYLLNFGAWKDRTQFEAEFAQLFDALGAENVQEHEAQIRS